MNTSLIPRPAIFQLLSTNFALLASASVLLAQGPLTPPGAPAPTMKSLDQIEARTPISSVPFTISSSGSYYLTKNLTVSTGDAVTINASNITLDLNGFAISSTQNPAGVGTAILLGGGLKHITIFNGAISSGVTVSGGTYSGTGFGYGITYGAVAPTNVRVSHVSVSGCLVDGIALSEDTSCLVESCTVDTVGHHGIIARTVLGSIVLTAGTTGILANNVSDCTGQSVSSQTLPGIQATVVSNCIGTSNNGDGIYAGQTALNSYGVSLSGGNGINAQIATNCFGVSSSGIGLFANYAATNCVGVCSSGRGLFTTTGTGCFGQTATGDLALYANGSYFCRGWQTDNAGVAIGADLAIGCTVGGGTVTAGQKLLGTP